MIRRSSRSMRAPVSGELASEKGSIRGRLKIGAECANAIRSITTWDGRVALTRRDADDRG